MSERTRVPTRSQPASTTDDVTVLHGSRGGRLVVVTEGRDIYDVFDDEHMLGNSRVAPCSKQLKQEPARRWVEANYEPEQVTLHVGIDWTEVERLEPNQAGWSPYHVEAPMTEKPYMDKDQVLAWLRTEGIDPPRLYDQGFKHANCGGFCVRMGHSQARTLLRVHPDRFAYHERREQEFRDKFDFDVAFLRDRSQNHLGIADTKPLTLREFREREEQQPSLFERAEDNDTRGCNSCFLMDADEVDGEPSNVVPLPGSHHVVMFSSGATSWAAARRIADRHGVENVTLLFTDVKGENPSPHAGEDEDNYRFLFEAAANVLGDLRGASAEQAREDVSA